MRQPSGKSYLSNRKFVISINNAHSDKAAITCSITTSRPFQERHAIACAHAHTRTKVFIDV